MLRVKITFITTLCDNTSEYGDFFEKNITYVHDGKKHYKCSNWDTSFTRTGTQKNIHIVGDMITIILNPSTTHESLF